MRGRAATFGHVVYDIFTDVRTSGVPAGVELRHMTRAQVTAIADALLAASEDVRRVQTTRRGRPHGKARLRLAVADGEPAVDARTFAALRRRKPKHIQEAS